MNGGRWRGLAALICLAGVVLGCNESGDRGLGGGGGSGGGGTGGATPRPRIEAGRPQGIYFMTRYWASSGSLEKAAWYFAEDGSVYAQLATGVQPEDLQSHVGQKGKITASGDELEITWSDGTSTKSKLELDGAGPTFMWDMGIFTPAAAIEDPSAIVGEYEGGESIRGGGSYVATAQAITLAADRSYQWGGVGAVSGESGGETISAGSSGETTGVWDAAGYTITFTSVDGKTERQIAFPVDDADTPVKPDRLFIGGLLFKRKG